MEKHYLDAYQGKGLFYPIYQAPQIETKIANTLRISIIRANMREALLLNLGGIWFGYWDGKVIESKT